FLLANKIFGSIGAKPSKVHEVEIPQNINEESPELRKDEAEIAPIKLNPFTMFDYVLIVLSSVGGLLYLFNSPLEKIHNTSLLPFEIGGMSGTNIVVLAALAMFLILLITRIARYLPIVRDRLIAVSIFGLFTVFFFAFFEQSLGSMTLFAQDYTDRNLTGNSAIIFKIIDSLLTTVPLIIISWVIYLLVKKTHHRIAMSNAALIIAFIGIWGLVLFRLYNNFNKTELEVEATWFGILNSFFIITLAPL